MTKDQEILNVLLELEKNMVKNLATAITEASNEKLVTALEEIFNNTKTAQRDIFNYMNEQGFYKLEYAPVTKVTKEEQKCLKTLESLEEI